MLPTNERYWGTNIVTVEQSQCWQVFCKWITARLTCFSYWWSLHVCGGSVLGTPADTTIHGYLNLGSDWGWAPVRSGRFSRVCRCRTQPAWAYLGLKMPYMPSQNAPGNQKLHLFGLNGHFETWRGYRQSHVASGGLRKSSGPDQSSSHWGSTSMYYEICRCQTCG